MLIPTAYRSLESLIQTQQLAHQRIFLRADLNVPITNGIIQSDYRLKALLPTLDLLLKEQATIIIATHIGRPTGPDPRLSTAQLTPWFAQHGYTVTFAANPETARTASKANKQQIIMLENLRFFPGEKKRDPFFAQQLADLGDYYVCDSFATLHRNDSSIAQVPYLFAADHRCIGLLVGKELTELYTLMHQPKRPFVLLLGGGKIADKIPLLEQLLDTVDIVLLGPAIVFSFAHALGLPTGSSLVDPASQALCVALLEKARSRNIQLLFPSDYYVAYDSFTGPLEPVPVQAEQLQAGMVGITIGPDTVDHYTAALASAGSILINGLMGDVNRPTTLLSSGALFKAVAHNTTAVRVVGGGDSVAAVELLGLQSSIGHMSTGGGSLLALLTNQPVTGLQPFAD